MLVSFNWLVFVINFNFHIHTHISICTCYICNLIFQYPYLIYFIFICSQWLICIWKEQRCAINYSKKYNYCRQLIWQFLLLTTHPITNNIFSKCFDSFLCLSMPLIQRRILNIRPNRCDNLVAHIGLLFNMCYHDLVNLLSESTGGICINGFSDSYYVFCHADDLLFTSLTETGFQKLINVANEYITSHGLRFNVLTRQSHLFYITRGVSNFSGSLPKYNLPRIWNEWTPKIPEYTSRTNFKNNIHKSFIASYLESVKCSNNYCRDCFPVRPDHIG